jgi:hypothetical protein
MMINAQTKKLAFIPCTHPPQGNSPRKTLTHPLKVQRLSPTEMEDFQRHRLYYNCDEKYAPSHLCKEHKLFQIDMTTGNYMHIATSHHGFQRTLYDFQ